MSSNSKAPSTKRKGSKGDGPAKQPKPAVDWELKCKEVSQNLDIAQRDFRKARKECEQRENSLKRRVQVLERELDAMRGEHYRARQPPHGIDCMT